MTESQMIFLHDLKVFIQDNPGLMYYALQSIFDGIMQNNEQLIDQAAKTEATLSIAMFHAMKSKKFMCSDDAKFIRDNLEELRGKWFCNWDWLCGWKNERD